MPHSDYVHCGVGILPMFKRTMNKVFSCADDCSIKMYYQDTDSIHSNYDDVDQVVQRYRGKHDQDLVGMCLGNFHIGRKMADARKDAEIYGIESLFLGKRTYTYILELTDKYGNTINSKRIRCRGIPTSCIKCKASQDIIILLYICKNIYKGEVIKLGLTNDLTIFV